VYWRQAPPETHAAHRRLRAAPGAPAQLFLAEYGGLRPLAQLHPPFSSAEQLFLSGLLHAVGGGAPQVAHRLCTPLLAVMPQDASPVPASLDAEAAAHWQHTPLPFLHDVAQALALLVQRPTLRLQHARWLPPSALRALNRRLAAPALLSAAVTHRRTPALRTLWFLAVQANLIEGAHVTATGWAWAALAPATQLSTLWNAWLDASSATDARKAYHQPDAGWDAATRARCAALLAQCPRLFRATDLANALLSDETLSVAFFAAHFRTLTELDHALATLLDELFATLGLVVRHGDAHYSLTATGRWLLAHASPPLLSWKRGAACAAHWRSVTPDVLCLQVAWDTAPDLQLVLAQFSLEDATPQEAAALPEQHYCFSAASIARATALGASIATFWQTLIALELPPHSVEALQLRQWWEAAANPIYVARLPILRTRSTTELAHLAQQTAIKPFLAEVIAPTVAIVTGDIDALLAHLRRAGLPVLPDMPDEPAPADDNGVLWLAGKVYQQLGRYLPLPAPFDARLLDRLFATQPPWQQALLQAQYERLIDLLADLLDNLPFTPPPTPTD
ncbi:MAG TPA: hypothetical protein GX400_01575, partial [Chloroflexi bacterium]|nr:hypothetical protein [Chloroflexota bacterium]